MSREAPLWQAVLPGTVIVCLAITLHALYPASFGDHAMTAVVGIGSSLLPVHRLRNGKGKDGA